MQSALEVGEIYAGTYFTVFLYRFMNITVIYIFCVVYSNAWWVKMQTEMTIFVQISWDRRQIFPRMP